MISRKLVFHFYLAFFFFFTRSLPECLCWVYIKRVFSALFERPRTLPSPSLCVYGRREGRFASNGTEQKGGGEPPLRERYHFFDDNFRAGSGGKRYVNTRGQALRSCGIAFLRFCRRQMRNSCKNDVGHITLESRTAGNVYSEHVRRANRLGKVSIPVEYKKKKITRHIRTAARRRHAHTVR